jgi:hypothetical protein
MLRTSVKLILTTYVPVSRWGERPERPGASIRSGNNSPTGAQPAAFQTTTAAILHQFVFERIAIQNYDRALHEARNAGGP